jgi:phospholipid/cholesterol/gamma-HCH transport system permease protein
MTRSGFHAEDPPIGPEPGIFRSLRIPAAIGRRIIRSANSLLYAFATAMAVLRQGIRPLTWRRTVRREFVHHCFEIGMHSLVFTMTVGALVGMGLVYQLLYWLELFGQSQLIGDFLTLLLARELAPILVGFFVLGRHALVMVVELGRQKVSGQIHLLDSQGIDPFLLLVVPRVLAVALCTFCLTIAFLLVALGSGFIFGNALGVTALTAGDYLDSLLKALGPAEFAIIPLKSLSIGFSVGLVACIVGLSEKTDRAAPETLLPRAFGWSALTIILISATLTLLL